ncbi:MAG: SMP-30/gluconolactonase/LRE family protein [Burkholderiales bacterium]
MNCKFELVHGPLQGPIGGLAWDGEAMLFSDINGGVILRYDPRGKSLSTARKYTNRVNGIACGADGVLYACQEGSRRIVRLLPDGSAMVPATKLDGSTHNNPCMLALDRGGRVWFSDPHHPLPAAGPHLFPLLDHQSVLRLECGARPQSHWHIERMTFDTASPRGVALSPDEKTLYVAETDNKPGGVRELRAYPILEDGTLAEHIVLHTFGADRRGVHRGIEGMCIDRDGNIVACAGWRRSGPGPLVYVFAPSGAVLETHPVPADMPLNCAFGDAGLDSLYVSTADGHVFRAASTGRKGHSVRVEGTSR